MVTYAKENIKKEQYLRIITSFLFTIFIMCIYISFASGDYWAGDGYDLTSYREKIENLYNIAKAVVLPLAAVSAAAGGYKMLSGDENSANSGKKQIKITLLAVAVFFCIPLIVSFGIELGQNHGWQPPDVD